jgi:tRNA pseudouridine55 synthase
VHGWEDVRFAEASLTARIICSGGTYIRALARDLGRLASSAGHLQALRRTKVGRFDVSDAPTLDNLIADSSLIKPLRVVTDA